MLRLGSFPAHDISGTMLEKLPQRLSRFLIEWGCFQRCPHMFQPGAPLTRADPKTRVRFPQTQPPAALGLLFIAAQELNEESGELFDGAFVTLARKQWTQ